MSVNPQLCYTRALVFWGLRLSVLWTSLYPLLWKHKRRDSRPCSAGLQWSFEKVVCWGGGRWWPREYNIYWPDEGGAGAAHDGGGGGRDHQPSHHQALLLIDSSFRKYQCHKGTRRKKVWKNLAIRTDPVMIMIIPDPAECRRSSAPPGRASCRSSSGSRGCTAACTGCPDYKQKHYKVSQKNVVSWKNGHNYL